MGSAADHDRLIEEGLTLYGSGDLDGALLIWEQVLAVDPQNEQAKSYVEYVRMNYDMLTSEPGTDDSAPFGIADDIEPEYTIEVSDGELPDLPQRPVSPAPLYMDPMDAGWIIEDELVGSSNRVVATSMDDLDDAEPATIEMEADEPYETYEPAINRAPTANHAPPVKPRAGTLPGDNFDDATREFEGPRKTTRDLSDDFSMDEGTGAGFSGGQRTEPKPRDLGFVRPAGQEAPEPPELKMTLRTPGDAGPPPQRSAFETSFEEADMDLATGAHVALPILEADDLIASLPSPKAAHVAQDMPAPMLAPAAKPSETSHTRRTAVQKAIDLLDLDMPEHNEAPVPSATPTRDLGDRGDIVIPSAPTRELRQPINQYEPLISAPTRELGLRPGRVATEDEPTRTDQRIMQSAQRLETGATKSDMVLPFDPIGARAAQILDEVDAEAPAVESKEDQTRRRITTLLERATLWATVDLDRAVAAVDLALGEDPNSALAQKLIHRNRDTIMGVFQAFLGNMERAPELTRPLHELAGAPISPRAAFLLSRVDGTFTLDEILDVSGMPRLEAYRYLCQLFLRGILR